MWVARDKKNNSLYFYNDYPYRVDSSGFWEQSDSCRGCISIDDNLFPNLKWEDEPIEVSLIETFRLQSLRAIK